MGHKLYIYRGSEGQELAETLDKGLANGSQAIYRGSEGQELAETLDKKGCCIFRIRDTKIRGLICFPVVLYEKTKIQGLKTF